MLLYQILFLISICMNLISEKKTSILCPLCGSKFTPQFSNICQACTLASVDDEKLLSAGDDVKYCRFCQRFQRPPWINCHRESQQMLEILLKKVKGLNKVHFLGAKFVWTQPHSKRFKLKINIRKDINDKMQMEQTQVVEFIEIYTQCPDCKKNFTPHDWNTVIQVRQMVDHKRTFLNLEQNLLKQKFASKVLKIEPAQHGVDFFFKSENDSIKYLDYIKSNLPVLLKNSKQLISHNERDNTSNVKTTFSITLPKICRDDLVKIPPKLCKQFGNCSPILLCLKITKYLYFMDVTNFKKIIMNATQYFLYEDYIQIFVPKIYAREYLVLNNEGIRNEESNNICATYGIIVTQGPKQIYVRSQMDLECDNDVLGYDLTQTQDMQAKNTPDIVLFKKLKKKEEEQPKEKKKKQISTREKLKQQKQKKRRQIQRKVEEIKQAKEKQEEKEFNSKEEQLDWEWQDISDDDQLGDGAFEGMV